MGAGERGDDAARHRLANAKRIADGKHDVANLEDVGIGEVEGGEFLVLGVKAQHDEIGAFVPKDDLGQELAAVGQRHGDLSLSASLDDVVVRDRKAVRTYQYARSERVLDTLARNAEIASEQTAGRRDHQRTARRICLTLRLT